jgi:hypothetical protein
MRRLLVRIVAVLKRATKALTTIHTIFTPLFFA